MGTRAILLERAQDHMQRKGYNGFSYADLAEEMGVCKATIHHHFATKADLGQVVMNAYRNRFAEILDEFDREQTTHKGRLDAYINLFRSCLEQNRKICLAMMLAAARETLPDIVKVEVTLFFQANDRWLTGVLLAGRNTGEFSFRGAPEDMAKLVFSALGGAMVIAESAGDLARLRSVSEWVMSSLTQSPVPETSPI